MILCCLCGSKILHRGVIGGWVGWAITSTSNYPPRFWQNRRRRHTVGQDRQKCKETSYQTNERRWMAWYVWTSKGTPRDPYGYIKTKKFKIDNIHCERGFFTFWAILALSAARRITTCPPSFRKPLTLLLYMKDRKPFFPMIKASQKNLFLLRSEARCLQRFFEDFYGY